MLIVGIVEDKIVTAVSPEKLIVKFRFIVILNILLIKIIYLGRGLLANDISCSVSRRIFVCIVIFRSNVIATYSKD